MSKGGQAKVYFVLYLAVVLELLIIIVERDEAEEHLHRQNSETMKIVESILSQLYSGSGSEGINTKPRDEITLPAETDMAAIKEIFGRELKTSRQYLIQVGVTDVTLAVKKKEGETSKEYDARIAKLLSLANVEELEYQIFYSPVASETDTIPAFQTEKYIRENNIDFMKFESGQSFPGPNGEQWQFVGAYKLNFDKEAAYRKLDLNSLQTTLDFVPVYKQLQKNGNGAAPRGLEDSAFYYSNPLTIEAARQSSSGAQKRNFVINFEPPDRSKAGLYKLRFASQTNRILGVASLGNDNKGVGDDQMVNIGTVQLSVRDLKKVARELKRRHAELDRIEDIDALAGNTQGPNAVEAIRSFDKNVNEAMLEATKSDNAADIIGKIRLYDYIAKLVTPGQSVNFDQNRGDFDINIRVQTAKPSTAKPYISTLTDDRCFSNAKHVCEVEVGPYKGPGLNRVTGKVLGINADIVFEQESGITPERDKKYKLRGTVNRELSAGKYVLQYIHEISGKSETVFDTLFVYDVGIQDEKRTDDRIARRANYGSKLAVDLLPNSGNDIPASQFKTYISFDGGNKKAIEGYKLIRDNNIEFLANYNNTQVTLVWVQPYTYKEYQLYTRETSIKLEEPSILADVMAKYSGSGNKIKIELSGLQIFAPATGLADKNLKVALSEPELKEASIEVNGYSISRQPAIVGGDPENGYTIELELSKNSGANVKSAEGVISIPISVLAKHPTNGKTVRGESEIRFQVDYTPSASRNIPGKPSVAPSGGGAVQPKTAPKPQPQQGVKQQPKPRK